MEQQQHQHQHQHQHGNSFSYSSAYSYDNGNGNGSNNNSTNNSPSVTPSARLHGHGHSQSLSHMPAASSSSASSSSYAAPPASAALHAHHYAPLAATPTRQQQQQQQNNNNTLHARSFSAGSNSLSSHLPPLMEPSPSSSSLSQMMHSPSYLDAGAPLAASLQVHHAGPGPGGHAGGNMGGSSSAGSSNPSSRTHTMSPLVISSSLPNPSTSSSSSSINNSGHQNHHHHHHHHHHQQHQLVAGAPLTPGHHTSVAAAAALNAMHLGQHQNQIPGPSTTSSSSSHPQGLGLDGISGHPHPHPHPHLQHSASSYHGQQASASGPASGPAASAPPASATPSHMYEDLIHQHPYSPYSATPNSSSMMSQTQQQPSHMYSHQDPGTATATTHHQQQHHYRQPQGHMHGAETPPSPSTTGAGTSHRHSLSDSMPYTPQSYTSPASSIPNSLHLLGNKHSFDSITGSSATGGEGSQHQHQSLHHGGGGAAMYSNTAASSSDRHLPMTPTHGMSSSRGGPYPTTPQHQHSHSRPSSQLHQQLQQHLVGPSSSTSSSPAGGPLAFHPHHPHHQHTLSAPSMPPPGGHYFTHQPPPPPHLHQNHMQQQQQQPPLASYPLSHSAQGFLTVYTAFPMYGVKDTQVTLEVGIAPHEPQHIRGFRVLFGSHGTTTRVVGEYRTEEGEERVELVAITPPVHLTNRIPSHGNTCQISLQALDEAGKVADWSELGVFEYTDVSSPLKGHKRPGSPLSSTRDSPGSNMRPVFPDQSPYVDGRSAAAAHKRGHSRGSSIGSLVNGFGHMTHHSRNSSLTSTLSSEYEQLAGSVVGPAQTGSTMWYSTPEGELIERKPIARLRAAVTQHTSTPSSSSLRHPPMEPAGSNTPTLYRTSQLPNLGPDGASNVAQKAALKFEGDLNNMALGWSHDEWHAKRRLVLFNRRQEGGIIHVNFRPTSLQEITPNTIVISCIFRDDKNECFVTSVDTIYLLEALVAVRFTVEEKNRIRRNLEGYKPITITKAKADCENFFKVIMGFPNPKPRNIEKDVKVFPWKILANAMKKIISKYSASFLSPEEMVGPGKTPPQPIGWAPGRTPPPSSQGTTSPPQRDDAVLGPPLSTYPASGGGGGDVKPLHMVAMDGAPSHQAPMDVVGPPLGSSYDNKGEHLPPGTASSTMGASMYSDGAVQRSLSHTDMSLQLDATSANAKNIGGPGNHAQYHGGTIDELATPNANYDASASTKREEANPFQFT